MAYIRGEPYVWSDGDHLHIWTECGAEDLSKQEGYAGNPSAAGVAVPEPLMDQFAVMRFAELLRLGVVPDVVKAALEGHGRNFGGQALAEYAVLLSGLRAPKS